MSIRAVVPLLIATLLALSGCATMNEDECRTADWRAIGFADGVSGRLANHVDVYRRDCAKVSITPNTEAWLAGRADGLLEYCVPAIGFRDGRSNRDYLGVCPADLEAVFLDAWREGRQLGALEREISALKTDISRKAADVERMKQDVLDAEAALLEDDTPTEVRREALNLVKTAQETIGTLETEMHAQEVVLLDLQDELRLWTESRDYY